MSTWLEVLTGSRTPGVKVGELASGVQARVAEEAEWPAASSLRRAKPGLSSTSSASPAPPQLQGTGRGRNRNSGLPQRRKGPGDVLVGAALRRFQEAAGAHQHGKLIECT